MTTTPTPMATRREQTKLLKDRIARVRFKHTEPKDPAPIAAARKLVAAHDKAMRDVRTKAYDEHEKLRREATERVYFGTPAQALAAVKAFERAKGSRRS